MKSFFSVLILMVIILGMISCKSTPAPGEPGNRQRYRPLIHHLRRNHPERVADLNQLKEDDPAEFKKKLSSLNKEYTSSIKRVMDKDGNFTCGCEKCTKQ